MAKPPPGGPHGACGRAKPFQYRDLGGVPGPTPGYGARPGWALERWRGAATAALPGSIRGQWQAGRVRLRGLLRSRGCCAAARDGVAQLQVLP